MSDFKRPGVYLSESLAPPVSDVGISLSNGCIVGPMSRGPVGLVKVTSFTQFTQLYGGFAQGTATSDMLYAAYQFFNNGGRVLYVVRVMAGTETIAEATLLDKEATGTAPTRPRATLLVKADNPGAWGNSLSVAVVGSPIDPSRFTLTVYRGGSTAANVVEKFADLTMDNTDPRYALNIVNSAVVGSLYVTLTDENVMRDPTVPASLDDAVPADTGTTSGGVLTVVPVPLTGGTDASAAPVDTAYDAALTLVDGVADPLTLNLPGITTATLVNKAIAYAENRGDVFVVVDGVTTVAGTPPAAADAVAASQSYTASSYRAVYFPRPVISDPASSALGATVVVPPGGAVLGQFAANDAGSGVQKTPAGLGTRIANAIGLEVALNNADLDLLNTSNVNAIRSLPGSGVVIFGGRTGSITGRADKYISVRRSLIYIKAELARLTQFALFESNYYLTWQQVSNVVEQFLLGFWASGGLVGSTASEAFSVVCDDTNNTEQVVASGEMHLDVQVALQRPAEFLAIQISQVDGVVNAVEAA